jgi:hypothetical protein
VSVQLHSGKFRHPRLPLPLDALNCSLHYSEAGLVVERCDARSGNTRITGKLRTVPHPFSAGLEDFESFLEQANITVQQLPLSPELFARLPRSLRDLDKQFKPGGPLSLTFAYERHGRSWTKHCIAKPEGMSAVYEDFTYPLRGITGSLDQFTSSEGADRLNVDLKGYLADRPFTIAGLSEGQGDERKIDLTIQGNSIPLDPRLEAALGPLRRMAESFHITGLTDMRITIQRRPGESEATNRFHLVLHDLTLKHEIFPYPLENVSGTLDITAGSNTKWELHDFRGHHHGGELTLSGTHSTTPSGSVLEMRVEGAGVPLDDDLARALARLDMGAAWKVLGPRGRASFIGKVTRIALAAPPGAPEPPANFKVSVSNLTADSILPDFMPYELNDVSCSFDYADREITIKDMQARHGASRFRIGPSRMVIKKEGGVWGKFQDAQLVPFIPDDDLIQALPPPLRLACSALQLGGPMTLSAKELVVDVSGNNSAPLRGPDGIVLASRRVARVDGPQPWIYWDNAGLKLAGASLKLGARWEDVQGELISRGEYRDGKIGAVIGNATIDQANILRQPFHNVKAHLVMDPGKAAGVLQVRDIQGQFFRGSLVGEAQFTIDPDLKYALSLQAIKVRLEELARFNRLDPDAQWSGSVNAKVFISGKGGDLSTLTGGGSIDVPHGRFYDLPLLLDLLKFLKLRTPDGVAFEEAHGKFRVNGQQVRIDEIELLGKLINLTGEGTMKLDGSDLRLDVYTLWSRTLQALPGPARDVGTSVSRGLYKIEMRGSIGGTLDFRQEAVPFLVDPAKRLLERVSGRGWE